MHCNTPQNYFDALGSGIRTGACVIPHGAILLSNTVLLLAGLLLRLLRSRCAMN